MSTHQSPQHAWRKEFGSFLSRKRTTASRADFGLPAAARGKTVGLRREEVAVLSNMSVTWYTWLEQGREVNPSREILAALAGTLRLSEAEQRYMFSLFGYAMPDPAERSDPAVAPGHLKNLLDAINPNPALAITRNWDVVAWNRSYAGLFPPVEELPQERRNLLRMVFTNPAVRELLPDWEVTSSQFLAEFRADTAGPGNDPSVTDLVESLKNGSEEFRRQWQDVGIRGFVPRTRTFTRPGGEAVTYGYHQLTLADVPSVKIIIYSVLPEDAPQP